MDRFRAQLTELLEASDIRTPFRFSWLGHPVPQRWTLIRKHLSPTGSEALFRDQLRNHLYQCFYCVGTVIPDSQPTRSWARRARVIEFLHDLSVANRGRGSWQPGWRMTKAGHPAEIQKSGLSIYVTPQEYRLATNEAHEAGAVLRMPKELFEASPGYYVALGNEPLGAEPVVRLYWNVTPGGAIRLVRAATERLNCSRIPFQIKALSDPSAYSRCDAVVLYVGRSNFRRVANWVARIEREVSNELKEGVPALTKLLAPGVGLAEDPPEGGSFGWNRCTVIVDSLIAAHEEGLRRVPERLGHMEATLAAHGIRAEAPFLNAGSQDEYALTTVRRRPIPARFPEPRELLEAAAMLARRLCAEAIWAGDRCNWVGPLPDREIDDASDTGIAALGPEIYSGASGIALFLALASAQTQDSSFRATALGAIRQAVSRVEEMTPRTAPPGFYTGWTGVALAAAWIGALLSDEGSLKSSRALITKFVRRRRASGTLDLISGCAGAIPSLLRLAGILDDPACTRLATSMGNELLLEAIRDDGECSWHLVGRKASGGLIGMSHGAAGIAYALLELYDATHDSRYCDTALAAFRFERRWFDSERGDWRDTRGRRGKTSDSSAAFTPTWCHGAPGIALTRLRGYEITGDDLVRAEALAGLEATRRAVHGRIFRGPDEGSLCHGAAGRADVLLSGCVIADIAGSGAYRKLASAAAASVAADFLDDSQGGGDRWARKPFGLMLGLAGAGYLCLRACDPRTPSLLLAGGRDPVSAGVVGSSPQATRLSA